MTHIDHDAQVGDAQVLQRDAADDIVARKRGEEACHVDDRRRLLEHEVLGRRVVSRFVRARWDERRIRQDDVDVWLVSAGAAPAQLAAIEVAALRVSVPAEVGQHARPASTARASCRGSRTRSR